MRVNLDSERWKEEALSHGVMGGAMKETSKMERRTAKAHTIGQAGRLTSGAGASESNTVLE